MTMPLITPIDEHLRIAGEAFKRIEGRDPEEVVGAELPTPATFETNRAYVTDILENTVDLRLIVVLNALHGGAGALEQSISVLLFLFGDQSGHFSRL